MCSHAETQSSSCHKCANWHRTSEMVAPLLLYWIAALYPFVLISVPLHILQGLIDNTDHHFRKPYLYVYQMGLNHLMISFNRFFPHGISVAKRISLETREALDKPWPGTNILS